MACAIVTHLYIYLTFNFYLYLYYLPLVRFYVIVY